MEVCVLSHDDFGTKREPKKKKKKNPNKFDNFDPIRI